MHSKQQKRNLLHALMSFVLPYTGHGEATVCLYSVYSMLESMTQCLGKDHQDAGEFLTGVMANMCDLLTLAKR